MMKKFLHKFKRYFKRYLNRTSAIVAGGTLLLCCVIILIFSKPNNIPNQAMEEIIDLSSNIHNKFKAKPDYWGLSTEYVIQNKLAKESMISGSKLVSVTGNEVIIGETDEGFISMPGSHSFDIVYKNLSRRYCVILSSYHLEYAEKLGLLSITIKNHSSKTVFSWGGDNRLPVSIAEAKRKCLSSENTLIWSFK